MMTQWMSLSSAGLVLVESPSQHQTGQEVAASASVMAPGAAQAGGTWDGRFGWLMRPDLPPTPTGSSGICWSVCAALFPGRMQRCQSRSAAFNLYSDATWPRCVSAVSQTSRARAHTHTQTFFFLLGLFDDLLHVLLWLILNNVFWVFLCYMFSFLF